jgi:hypothetical protein
MKTFALLLSLLTAAAAQAESTFHFVKEIPIGGDGGWD